MGGTLSSAEMRQGLRLYARPLSAEPGLAMEAAGGTGAAHLPPAGWQARPAASSARASVGVPTRLRGQDGAHHHDREREQRGDGGQELHTAHYGQLALGALEVRAESESCALWHPFQGCYRLARDLPHGRERCSPTARRSMRGCLIPVE